MEVIQSTDNIELNCKSVVTVGTFDGIHLGHRKLFERVKAIADEKNFKSFIVTFDPHPRQVLSPENQPLLLSLKEDKIETLNNCRIDYLFIINFTKEFSQQSYEKFVEDFLVKKLNLGMFVIGHDHKFGKDRKGDENRLRELADKYNFEIEVVEPVVIDNEVISSTKIRNSLSKGEIKKANKFLGREYSYTGRVVHGATRGRILGFPTANVEQADSQKIIPAGGVYAVRCNLEEKEYFGIMNIGFRPTFETGGKLVSEVHIFDFNEDIYNKEIKISFIDRLRDEKKFASKEELIYQIERDKKKAIQIISTVIN
ncbi:MAG: bifunctional riboflavin kinase/FAD synthetase [Ignavibacteriales bacterium]